MKIHGQSSTRLYHVWRYMRRRCTNPTFEGYKNYGGRGIKVCRAWQKFETFWKWAIATGYAATLTIDRKNTDKDYCPSNCRWATRLQQNQSRRKQSNNTSGYIGIVRVGRKWRARVGLNGTRHLGYYSDPFSAAWIRDTFVRQHFDACATLNNLKDRRKRKKMVAGERRICQAFI